MFRAARTGATRLTTIYIAEAKRYLHTVHISL
jgi:hypothetical protein